jgi:hypothetical protein
MLAMGLRFIESKITLLRRIVIMRILLVLSIMLLSVIDVAAAQQHRTTFMEAINQYVRPWVAEDHILQIDSRFANLKNSAGVELRTRYAGENLALPELPKRVMLNAQEAETCVAAVKLCAAGNKMLLRLTGYSETEGVVKVSFSLEQYPGVRPPDRSGMIPPSFAFGVIGVMDLVRDGNGWRVTGARYNTIG